jgi:hypothetical protein
VDDSFVAVDRLFGAERRAPRWADERPEPKAQPLPTSSQVQANLARAKAKSLPATLTKPEWRKLRRAFRNCCAYCGDSLRDSAVIDHVWPLARGGGTTIENVLPSCGGCNSSKSWRDPFEWIALIGWEQFVDRYRAAAGRMP